VAVVSAVVAAAGAAAPVSVEDESSDEPHPAVNRPPITTIVDARDTQRRPEATIAHDLLVKGELLRIAILARCQLPC
jgi:hypothetical protein